MLNLKVLFSFFGHTLNVNQVLDLPKSNPESSAELNQLKITSG
jgi:hypothetical protein